MRKFHDSAVVIGDGWTVLLHQTGERARFLRIDKATVIHVDQVSGVFLAPSECRFDSRKAVQVFSGIPFLNGGLFECLDKTVGAKEKPEYIRIDGFSDRDDNPLAIPDFLFFGDEREVDLSAAYGETRFKHAKVRGLIHIFYRYKFTITENTPIEEEIALDPELAGKVFENLLAAYNPETSWLPTRRSP